MNAITAATPDWTKIDTPVKHQGKEIVLPSDPGNMDYDDAIETIARIRDQENQEFDVREIVKAAPWDAAVALYRAMQDIYGVVLSESIHTFFGEIKPDFLTVQTGPADDARIQVPVGRMSLPGVEAPIFLQLSPEGATVSGTVRKRDRARLIEIANRARAILKEASVYRGKAIRIPVDDDGDLDVSMQPEFIDLTRVAEADMIHTAEPEPGRLEVPEPHGSAGAFRARLRRRAPRSQRRRGRPDHLPRAESPRSAPRGPRPLREGKAREALPRTSPPPPGSRRQRHVLTGASPVSLPRRK